MWRLLSDENFNGDILRGLTLRQPALDVVRTQDVGLVGVDDAAVLAWAADHDRVLLTHDRATMPDYAYERIAANARMPGVIIVNDRHPVRQAIDEIFLLITCSAQEEWNSAVVYLPL
jgi:hypothetical protein